MVWKVNHGIDTTYGIAGNRPDFDDNRPFEAELKCPLRYPDNLGLDLPERLDTSDPPPHNTAMNAQWIYRGHRSLRDLI